MRNIHACAMESPESEAALVVLSQPIASISTAGGFSASLEGEKIVLRDERRREVAVFDSVEGEARLEVRHGDLTLSAPRGRLRLCAGEAIELDAPRIEHRAESYRTAAREVSFASERFEVRAERIRQWAKDAFCDVAELFQVRADRTRVLARETLQLFGRRTTMRSEEETEINGRRVLLG